MAKLNFNFSLKGLDSKPIMIENKEANAGKVLAQQLFQNAEGDALKQTEWAYKLYNGEELDLDSSDTELLKGIINKPNNFVAGIKYQLLNICNNQAGSNTKKK